MAKHRRGSRPPTARTPAPAPDAPAASLVDPPMPAPEASFAAPPARESTPPEATSPAPIPALFDAYTFPLFALVSAGYTLRARNGFVADDVTLLAPREPVTALRELAAFATHPTWNNLPAYRPLARALLALEQSAFHGRSAPYHAVNAALVGLIAVFARGLFSTPGLDTRPAFALAGAALVALHPITAGGVFPASGGVDALAAAAVSLGAMVAWLRPGAAAHTAAVVALAAALLLDGQSIALAFLFVWADLCGLSRDAPGRSPDRWFARHAPVALTTLAWVAVRIGRVPPSARPHLALGADPVGPLRSLLYAVQSIVAPAGRLAPDPAYATWFSPTRMLACALVVTLAASAVRRAGPAMARPARFWAVWFALAVLPVANVFAQPSRFVEHALVLALVAAAGLLCSLASTQWEPPSRRYAAGAAVAVAALALGAVTLHRATFYRTQEAWLEAWTASNPAHTAPPEAPQPAAAPVVAAPAPPRRVEDTGDAQSHLERGVAASNAGSVDEAITHFRTAMTQEPRWNAPMADHLRLRSRIHYNLARALNTQRRTDEAIREYRAALSDDENYAYAHTNLALLLEQKGDRAEALEHIRAALRAQPDLAIARTALGRLQTP